MIIEEAIKIIDNTNFYKYYTNTNQDQAFDMAFRALKLFRDYKKEVKELENIKGDRVAHVIANQFRIEIEKLEGGAKNGD